MAASRSSGRWRCGAHAGWALAPGLALLAACETLLGEHTVFGEGRHCATDEDCPKNERCDPDGELCRKRCDPDADAGATAQCGAYRRCSSTNDTCGEPVGSPCDSEQIAAEWCGAAECVGKDASGDEVPGYCTITCGYDDFSPPCPPGFECKDNKCLCTKYPDCVEG